MNSTDFKEDCPNTLSVGLHKTAKSHGAAHVVVGPELLKPLLNLRDLHKAVEVKGKAEVARTCDVGEDMLITSSTGLSVTSSEINR